MQTRALALAAAIAFGAPAQADAPRVATDIPPVHSLVARVMQGVGTPELVLPPGASPHGHAMRPSEAAALADADVVIWVGEALTPWLGRAIEALAPEAASLALLEAAGTSLLDYGHGAAPDARDHAPAGEGEAHAAEHRHVHAGTDPHAWLDPQNAQRWLDAIAATLAVADPANADAYGRNAAQGRAEIDALTVELSAILAPVRDRPFIVFHDAYGYFVHRFGVAAAGAISLGDAAQPSPARLSRLRQILRETGVRCVFAEPQFAPGLVETVVEGTEARAATLDPIGASLRPGPDLYPSLMRNLARALHACLGDTS